MAGRCGGVGRRRSVGLAADGAGNPTTPIQGFVGFAADAARNPTTPGDDGSTRPRCRAESYPPVRARNSWRADSGTRRAKRRDGAVDVV